MTEDEYRSAQLELERERLALDSRRAEFEARFSTRHTAALVGAVLSIVGVVVSGTQIWTAVLQKDRELQLQQARFDRELGLLERRFQHETATAAKEASRVQNLDAVKLILQEREAIFSSDKSKRESVVELLQIALPTDVAARLFARLRSMDQAFAEAEKRILDRYKLIQIPASSFGRGVNVEVGRLPYGAGLVHNSEPYVEKLNLVEYAISTDAPGTYELWIGYAAAGSRPVEIRVNGDLVTKAGLSETTGGWYAKDAKLLKQATVLLKDGPNLLQLARQGSFPHIQTIEFRPIKPGGKGA